jgi:hypothetical protein
MCQCWFMVFVFFHLALNGLTMHSELRNWHEWRRRAACAVRPLAGRNGQDAGPGNGREEKFARCLRSERRAAARHRPVACATQQSGHRDFRIRVQGLPSPPACENCSRPFISNFSAPGSYCLHSSRSGLLPSILFDIRSSWLDTTVTQADTGDGTIFQRAATGGLISHN